MFEQIAVYSTVSYVAILTVWSILAYFKSAGLPRLSKWGFSGLTIVFAIFTVNLIIWLPSFSDIGRPFCVILVFLVLAGWSAIVAIPFDDD
ncbi:hypothetical protein QP373_04560 [Lactobacillus crispatus]|uniref:hypothetical protein n=1 Tax=Lactobacillus crispatus TaxID=47770 RepID=UPI002550948D|nr:hypothetical protein [Lactobacillus crispatus]MDK7065378.1 hypothetical protein [Lactobacillus crispatus]